MVGLWIFGPIDFLKIATIENHVPISIFNDPGIGKSLYSLVSWKGSQPSCYSPYSALQKRRFCGTKVTTLSSLPLCNTYNPKPGQRNSAGFQGTLGAIALQVCACMCVVCVCVCVCMCVCVVHVCACWACMFVCVHPFVCGCMCMCVHV